VIGNFMILVRKNDDIDDYDFYMTIL